MDSGNGGGETGGGGGDDVGSHEHDVRQMENESGVLRER